MNYDVVGLGNALMDALVVVDDDTILKKLNLHRGTMHPVDHNRWTEIYNDVKHLDVTFDSGGSCANTIATVGLMGGRTIYRGQVGSDKMGKLYASCLTNSCKDHALSFAKEGATGKCLSIISAEDAERTMITDLGVSILLGDVGEKFREMITSSKVAHFTGYTLLDGPILEVATAAIRHAKESGTTVSIDVADPFVVELIRDRMWDVLKSSADLVFLNKDEATALTGKDPKGAAALISEKAGVRTIVVKQGKEGSTVLHDGELYHANIIKVDAVDTTGAGDAYAGGYLFGLVNGLGPQACAQLASEVAGLTVAQIGAVVKDTGRLATAVAKFN